LIFFFSEGFSFSQITCLTDAEVYKLKTSLIIDLCLQNPILFQSFSFLVANKISFKIKSIILKSEDMYKNQKSLNKKLTRKNLLEKFKINGEEAVEEFSCKWKNQVKFSGKIYISKNYICFYSKSFGSKAKDYWPISDIVDVRMEKKSIFLEFLNTKPIKIITESNLFEIVNNIIISNKYEKADSYMFNLNHIRKKRSNYKINLGLYPTKNDWISILKGSRIANYKEGEVIIKNGSKFLQLYQIEYGSVSMEINDYESIISFYDKEIFGVVSFLEGNSPYNFVAKEDTKVKIIEGYYLQILFQYFPVLSGKFYFYLASCQAKRLQKIIQNLEMDSD